MATTKEKTTAVKKTSVEKKPASSKKASPAKATAVKTTATKTAKPKVVAKPKAATKPKAAVKKAPAKTSKVSPEQRYNMVAEAAYYIAERAGFSGNAYDYWIEAEAQIAKMLGK